MCRSVRLVTLRHICASHFAETCKFARSRHRSEGRCAMPSKKSVRRQSGSANAETWRSLMDVVGKWESSVSMVGEVWLDSMCISASEGWTRLYIHDRHY